MSVPNKDVGGEKVGRQGWNPESGENEEEQAPFRSIHVASSRPIGDFGLIKPANLFRSSNDPATHEAKLGVAKEWTASAPVWDVKASDLELVPTDFPLQKTHREIHANAEVVAQRLCDTLRKLSVTTEYDACKAKCSKDCVSFRIRLYAGNETGQPVVVEVQRRCGSGIGFMKTCRALLDAAEGIEKKPAGPSSKPCKAFGCLKPLTMMACLKDAKVQPKETPTLDTVFADRIRSDRDDLKILGLEELCCKMDAFKASPKDAAHTALQFLTNPTMRDDVLAIISRDSLAALDAKNETSANEARYLALSCFGNSLQVCDVAKIAQADGWFSETLVVSLMDELVHAERCTCNAYQACRCLSALLKVCETTNVSVHRLEQARAVGVRKHALLEAESKECLGLL